LTQYLTPKQVAERLQLAHQTILTYCNEGVFPGAFQAKKGGAWRIPVEDVERRQRPQGLCR
jgi:predicted site-specific integrase-resolvase